MPDAYKILGALAPTDSLGHVLYTTPSDKSAIITSISITNRSSTTDQLFSIYVYDQVVSEATASGVSYVPPTGGALFVSTLISANDVEVLEPGITLGPNSTIVIFLTSSLTAIAYGVELADVNSGNKILGQSSSLDTFSTIYSVPANKSSVVRSINVTNLGTSDAGVKLTIGPGGSPEPATSLFLVTGTNYGATSTDGVAWTTTKTNPSGQVYTGASSPQRALVYGLGSTASVSKNLTHFNSASSATLQSGYPSSAIYSLSRFVVMSGALSASTAVSASTDGVTWTFGAMPVSASWSSIASNGSSRFVAIAGFAPLYGGTATNAAAYSTDGITWTASTMPSSSQWSAIAYGSGRFVAIANSSSQSAYSTDGVTWTAVALPSSSGWTGLAFGSSTFVATSSSTSAVATSSIGTSWTARTSSRSGNSAITFGNGRFISTGGSGATTVAVSSNSGANWTTYTPPATANPNLIGIGYFSVVTDNYPKNQHLLYDYRLAPRETISIKSGMSIASGNIVAAQSIYGPSVAVNVFGVEFDEAAG